MYGGTEMKIEEAIKRLENIKNGAQVVLDGGFGNRTGEDNIVYRIRVDWTTLAIQALEKQIPIKPRYYTDMYDHERPGCPGCPRNEILYAGQSFCSVCGTKIDWGKEE